MRLVQVAKALGMTGQELRHELAQVNFGIKPTDREIPDGLAKGIVRFLAKKRGLTIDIDALGLESDTLDDQEKEDAPGSEQSSEASERQSEKAKGPAPSEAPTGAKRKSDPVRQDSLNVLRKLSLENVSQDAIRRQEDVLRQAGGEPVVKLTKEQREEIAREQKLLHASEKRTIMQEQIKKKEGIIPLPDQISVKEFAEKTGLQVPLVIQTLMKNGVLATITQSIDYDTAAIVAAEHGLTVSKEERAARAEDLLSRNLKELLKDEPENLAPRPPIVVVMGHVDHGKTAILDAIRETDVVAGEAGGITQHIGAYQADYQGKKITFLDTPGHEAFTAMRARGAQVTDIAIIVVSAEEGVKATTIEAIHHAQEAGVPILVAINKIDKERADVDRVKGELAAHDLQPEDWGGKTPIVLCSALTKQGIGDLLDHILLLAEIADLRANPARSAVATVIESHLDTSLGALATVVVNTGTLRVGDAFVCGGATTGKVKAMIDAHGKRLSEIAPSGAARISGFDGLPRVGDIVQVVASEKEARTLLSAVIEHAGSRATRSFADLVTRLSEGRLKQLKVVLKTDAQGSLEAIQEAFRTQTEGSAITVKLIHGAVGSVTESDVMVAAASDGIVLSFNAPVPPEVLRTADREGVKIREYDILYELLDEVDRLRKGMVEPVEEEQILGHLDVRGVFLTKKSEQIIGGRVQDGIIKRVAFRLMRSGAVVGTGRITSLKHVDRDIKEAKEGTECGLRIESTIPAQEGDQLETYVRELKRKESE